MLHGIELQCLYRLPDLPGCTKFAGMSGTTKSLLPGESEDLPEVLYRLTMLVIVKVNGGKIVQVKVWFEKAQQLPHRHTSDKSQTGLEVEVWGHLLMS